MNNVKAEKMNPEIKAAWVKALRSGKYEQATGALRTDEGGFCCLGVLCDLHRKSKKKGINPSWDGEEYLGSAGLPHQEVVDWAGLGNTNPDVSLEKLDEEGNTKTVKTNLTELNDDLDKNFCEIADIIEAQL